MTLLRRSDGLIEAYPEEVEFALSESGRIRRTIAEGDARLECLVRGVDAWPVDDTVTVAFLGGASDLHAAIADTAAGLGDLCGLELDFGYDPVNDTFRTWSPADQDYSADIRVSFDMEGYWSLVGMGSVDRSLTPSGSRAGGAPHQRSLNLGGFGRALGDGWRRTVLHQFLHALAVTHEHQSLLGASDAELRWDDDAGYELTVDSEGRAVSDVDNRRPGIYTYLAGSPNRWTKDQVDERLRGQRGNRAAQASSDVESVMLYRLDPIFFLREPVQPAASSDRDSLSALDERALRSLYPRTGRDSQRERQGREALAALDELMGSGSLDHATRRSAAAAMDLLRRGCRFGAASR